MKQLFQMAWRNIWRNKRRTLLTSASIFFAVFFAVVMRSFQIGSYDNMIYTSIESFSGHLQINHPEYFDEPSLDNALLYSEELSSVVTGHPDVMVATPRIESFSMVSTGRQSKGVLVTGISPTQESKVSNPEKNLVHFRLNDSLRKQLLEKLTLEEEQVESLRILGDKSYRKSTELSADLSLSEEQSKSIYPILQEGVVESRFLSDSDQGVLVSDRLSKYLKVSVGDTLILMGQGYHGNSASGLFPIRGIVRVPSPELDRRLVYMSLQRAQEFFSLDNRITSLAINVQNPKQMERVQSELQSKIDSEHCIVKNWKESNPTLYQQIESDNVSGLVFIGILYVIILFGIFGTVVMMVAERQREFGVMIAIGMKKWRLALVVVLEMILIGGLGSLSGVLASAPIVLYGYNNPFRVTGKVAIMYEEMGFEPILPLAPFDLYVLWQVITVIVMVVFACYLPLQSIRKLKVMKAIRG